MCTCMRVSMCVPSQSNSGSDADTTHFAMFRALRALRIFKLVKVINNVKMPQVSKQVSRLVGEGGREGVSE